MKTSATLAPVLALAVLSMSGCLSKAISGEEATDPHAEAAHHEHTIVVTSPMKQNVVTTQQYVCQIRSCQHIEVRALEGGYLQAIHVQEGQSVKKGELMFKILPVLYQAKLASESAEAKRTQIELENAETLLKKGIVSPQEIALLEARVAKAQADVRLAETELSFTDLTAPFDGIVDRQQEQLGSLIEEGDVLTTLSDNSVMWVYFNVPEARYLEYKAELDKRNGMPDHLHIELKLANDQIFPQQGQIGAIEADFDNTTGNIAFRADFPNPDGLLRNGQTGTILMHRTLDGAIVIPQRATFEILARQYVYVVDEDNVVHQRDITVVGEQEDIFLVEGLELNDKIILEGIRQVRDGDKVKYDFQAPEAVLSSLKYHAE